LIGGAAVVVAGVIGRVVVLDESVVLEADDEGDCDCDCDCVVELVLKPEGWDVDDDAADGDEVDEDEGGVEEVVEEEEADVMVVSVVSTAEDTAEDIAEEDAEEMPVMTAEAEEVVEEEAAAVAEEDSVLEEAADTEIKLPPLLNNVTVAG
jgi:hypothetical protein